jgi:DNA invertase Pin-like site-specific DNA recombinase
MPKDPPRGDGRRRLEALRVEAREHARLAGELAEARRQLIRSLLAEGVSQAAIARRLGITRGAVQRLLSG